MELKNLIEEAWEDRSLVKNKDVAVAVKTVIEDLDNGKRRIAEPDGDDWKVNEWLKKAVMFILGWHNILLRAIWRVM